MGIKIIKVEVVGVCSKCRKENDEIPKYKDGRIVPDKSIYCVSKAFGECKNGSKPRKTIRRKKTNKS